MNRSLRTAAAVTLAGLLQALGCASASPDSPSCSIGSEGCAARALGAEGAATPEQACADSAAAYCDKLTTCAPSTLRLLYGDIETCQTREALACVPNLQLAANTWTPAAQDACTSAVRAATCEQWLGQDEAALAACSFTRGPLANGAACGSSAQCQTGICHASASASCGVCGSAAQAGDACSSDGECDHGLICVNEVCAKLPSAGQGCATSTGCVTPYVCNGGVCAQPSQFGETCAPDTCDLFAGSFCAPGGTCQSFQYAAAGEPCSPSAGVLCERGGYCRVGTSSGAGVGTCVKFAPDGAACDPVAGPHCLLPAKCTDGFCSLTDPAVCR